MYWSNEIIKEIPLPRHKTKTNCFNARSLLVPLDCTIIKETVYPGKRNKRSSTSKFGEFISPAEEAMIFVWLAFHEIYPLAPELMLNSWI